MIRAAVLGKPIDHSLSPLVHSLIYRDLGIDSEYGRIELDQDSALEFLRRELPGDWSGFSLTMPLKEVGFELESAVSQDAQRAHSINTITRSGSFNTDISGLARVLRLESVHFTHVTIIGNGATARSTLVALDSLNFKGDVEVVRRSPSRDSLLPSIDGLTLRLRDPLSWSLFNKGEDELIVSTIPAAAQTSVSQQIAGFEGTLVDFGYRPWPSVIAGVSVGKVISGLKILVSQAVDQAAIFTGENFDLDDMYRRTLSSTAKELAAQ